jgi:hypothetical protein
LIFPTITLPELSTITIKFSYENFAGMKNFQNIQFSTSTPISQVADIVKEGIKS